MRKLTNLAMGLASLAIVAAALPANAAPVTDPNDPRIWQGASVGTFAALYFGSDTPANRQQVVDHQLLDDGLIDTAGWVAGLHSSPAAAVVLVLPLTTTGDW